MVNWRLGSTTGSRENSPSAAGMGTSIERAVTSGCHMVKDNFCRNFSFLLDPLNDLLVTDRWP